MTADIAAARRAANIAIAELDAIGRRIAGVASDLHALAGDPWRPLDEMNGDVAHAVIEDTTGNRLLAIVARTRILALATGEHKPGPVERWRVLIAFTVDDTARLHVSPFSGSIFDGYRIVVAHPMPPIPLALDAPRLAAEAENER